MNKELMEIIRNEREKFLLEGFQIIGIFGSRARDDFTDGSDLDILYKLDMKFYEENPGWEAAGRLEEIKEELSLRTGLNIDLANINALKDVGRKYILPEIVYLDQI